MPDWGETTLTVPCEGIILAAWREVEKWALRGVPHFADGEVVRSCTLQAAGVN